MGILEKFGPKSLAPLLMALGVVVPPSVPRMASRQQDDLLNPDMSGEKFAGCEDDQEFQVSDSGCSVAAVFLHTWTAWCGDMIAACMSMVVACCLPGIHVLAWVMHCFMKCGSKTWVVLFVSSSLGLVCAHDSGSPCFASCAPCVWLNLTSETTCFAPCLVDRCDAQLGDYDLGELSDCKQLITDCCKEALKSPCHTLIIGFWSAAHAMLAFGGCCCLVYVAMLVACSGLAKRSKPGQEDSKLIQAIVIAHAPQVESCCGGLAAAAQDNGNWRCCKAVSAARSACAISGVLELVGSFIAGFAMGPSRAATTISLADLPAGLEVQHFVRCVFTSCLKVGAVAAAAFDGVFPRFFSGEDTSTLQGCCTVEKGFLGITTLLHTGGTDRPPVENQVCPVHSHLTEPVHPGRLHDVQVFAQSLTGRHLVFRVPEKVMYCELVSILVRTTGTPAQLFYLTVDGRYLSGTTHTLVWLSPGQTVRMHGRLRGGTTAIGPTFETEWFCAACQRGGCWPTKPRCFRCNLPRTESDKMRGTGAPPSKGKKGNAQQREVQFLGRAPMPGPQFVTAPTWRPPKKPKQAPVVVAPPVTPNTNMIEVLKSLGCSEAVIQEVQGRLAPQETKTRSPGDKGIRLSEAQVALDKAKRHEVHLQEQLEAQERKIRATKEAINTHADRVTKLEQEVQEAKKAINQDSASEGGGESEEDERCHSVHSGEDELAGGLDADVTMYPQEFLDDAGPNKKAKMVAKAKAAPGMTGPHTFCPALQC